MFFLWTFAAALSWWKFGPAYAVPALFMSGVAAERALRRDLERRSEGVILECDQFDEGLVVTRRFAPGHFTTFGYRHGTLEMLWTEHQEADARRRHKEVSARFSAALPV